VSEELNRLEQLFHDALALPSAEERAEYLARACGADTALRYRVEKLLLAHSTAGQFLSPDTPVPTVLPESEFESALPEKPGDQIGHYSLVERIGEGGCCVVYLAEQAEPIRRQVALKLIKAGMDTRQVVARFEAERQALALMDHPNIAKVFEAGVSNTGRPYFVMELVRGIPINQFCDANQLSIKQRLELFMQVAHAVQHAHQKGIIHRDLKPSNILVTTGDSDGPFTSASAAGAAGVPAQVEANRSSPARSSENRHQPLPKIIDFGIAKAMQPGLTDRALVTWFGQFVGTPAYMSPEQAGMRNEDIDARSDIYSLGALLYELLTGVTPFDATTLATSRFDEILRLIQEAEPRKPSARLVALGDKLSEFAEARQTNPGSWRCLLRDDLDWIVMKALEKNPARRYPTAHDFAEDIQRHLTHEPVLAGPPGAAYGARKFVQRHRVSVAVSLTTALAVVAGLSIALLQLQRALRAEAVARQERDRAVQAEADARGMLAVFTDQPGAPDDPMTLYAAAARLARERLEPTSAAAYNFILPLGSKLGSLGAWSNSLEVYLWLTEAASWSCDYWTHAHAAALVANQTDASHRLRAEIVRRFGDTWDGMTAMQVARAILIDPDGHEHLQTALACADRALKAYPNHTWCQIVNGMAEYRRGNWSAAIPALHNPEGTLDLRLGAVACAFEAMAQYQAGQTNAAVESLGRASWRLQQLLHGGYLAGDEWHFVVFGLLARAEAERLILGREVSPPVTVASLAEARQKWKSVREDLVRGESLAREKNWSESRDAYARALHHPDFDWAAAEAESPLGSLARQMGAVFVRAGDKTNYAFLCRLLLGQEVTHPAHPLGLQAAGATANQYALACCLSPQDLPPELQQTVVEHSRFAAANALENPGPTALAGAMVEYYFGQPERAIDLAQEAATSPEPLVASVASLYRAMTLHKLNRPREAAAAMQKAEDLFPHLLKPQSRVTWWDLAQAELALQQARQLLRAEPK